MLEELILKQNAERKRASTSVGLVELCVSSASAPPIQPLPLPSLNARVYVFDAKNTYVGTAVGVGADYYFAEPAGLRGVLVAPPLHVGPQPSNPAAVELCSALVHELKRDRLLG